MKTYLPVVLMIYSLSAFAQQDNDRNAFYQNIDVAQYHGMLFRMQAAVKVSAGRQEGNAALWARINKKNGSVGFFDNMAKRPITLNEWKVYKITGNIDDSAKSLTIGGMYRGNGIFSFDDFQLEIKQSDSKWKKIDLANAGFESDTITGWRFFFNKKSFSNSIVKEDAFSGQNYFQVTGSGMGKVIAYGSNEQTGKYIKANGIKIYYEEYGSGEPLLLLHGNGQSIEAFSRQIPEFEKKYRVIAVDTRGHGKTEDKGDKFTYDLFAKDMNALLDKLHIDSANIVGWSDGGNTGLIMAMKYPKKAKRLVTMGAVIFCDSTVVSKDILDDLKFNIDELRNAKSAEDKNTLKRMLLLKDEPNYKFTDLKSIKCPALIMSGENDIIKAGHTKMIASSIPGGEVYIAPKETHNFPTENAAEFNRVVLDFLAK